MKSFNPTKEIPRVRVDYKSVPSQFLQNRFINGKYRSDLTLSEPLPRPEQDPRLLGNPMDDQTQENEDAFWLP